MTPNLTNTQPAVLGSILARDPFTETWSDAELGAIYEHQLGAPLAFDLSNLSPDAQTSAIVSRQSSAAPLETFADLLNHPHPPLELLQYVKEFSKASQSSPDHPLPGDVATVLYFATILIARLRLRQQISQVDNAALDKALHWCLARPWLDAATRSLFQQGLEQNLATA